MSRLLIERPSGLEVEFRVKKRSDGTFTFDVSEIDDEGDYPFYVGSGFTREHLIKLAKLLLVKAEVREWMVDDAPRVAPEPSQFSRLIAAEVARAAAQKVKD